MNDVTISVHTPDRNVNYAHIEKNARRIKNVLP